MISDEKLNALRRDVKTKLSEKRYLHTLGVEACAEKLGRIFIPDKVFELRAAALLHDITKELSKEEQLTLVSKGNLSLNEEDFLSDAVIHSFTAKPYVELYYPDLATADVLSAVYKHTVGDEVMTVFDEIIFLSDYVEDGRTHEPCVKTREFLEENLRKAENDEERLKTLHRAVLKSIRYTTDHLKGKNLKVNSKTELAYKTISALI